MKDGTVENLNTYVDWPKTQCDICGCVLLKIGSLTARCFDCRGRVYFSEKKDENENTST